MTITTTQPLSSGRRECAKVVSVVMVMLVAMVVVMEPTNAQSAIDSTTANLVLYFPFDDLTAVGPYTNTCPSNAGLPALVNAASMPGVRSAPGMIGNALSLSSTANFTFDFPDGLIETALFPRLATNQLSMMAWVKVTGQRTNSDGSCKQMRIIGDNTANFEGIGIFIDPFIDLGSSCKTRFNAYVQIEGQAKVFWRSGQASEKTSPNDGTFQKNEWIHVAATWDGKALRLFLNGSSAGASTTPGTDDDFVLSVGDPTEYIADIIGAVDDLRFYDTALQTSQLREVMSITRSLGSPSLTIDYPANITLAGVPQEDFLIANGTDPNGVALAYLWDLPTACQLFSFPNGATGKKVEISIFSKGLAVMTGSTTNSELCQTNTVSFDIIAAPVDIVSALADQSVFKNESSSVTVSVEGFPTPFISWEFSTVEEFILPNGSTTVQSFWKPIAGQNSATLTLFNTDGSFDLDESPPTNSTPRAAGESITVRAAVRSRLSGATIYSSNSTVVADTVLRPTPKPVPGDGDGDGDNKLPEIIVPVVVGSLICCCCCLLLLLLVFLILARGRRQEDSFYRINVVEPDYTELAYGRMLQPHHAATKKQLPALQRLEMLMINSNFVFTQSLCENAKATEADGLAKIVTFIYAGHDQATGLVQHFTTREVESSNKEGTLFRANSMASKMFTTYARIVASAYVWFIFARAVAELDAMAHQSERDEEEGMMGQPSQNSSLLGPVVMEVDPTKMEEAADDKVNTLQLWLVAQKLFVALESSSNHVPTEVRQILRHVHDQVVQSFNEQAAHKAMGGFLFLRLLCPSLMAPQVYGLLPEPPHPTSQRQLILLAKVMQNLANDTLPGKKEHYMERLNEFITSNQDSLRHFYDGLIRRADEGPRNSSRVPQEVRTNAVVQLHKFITDNHDRVLAQLSQDDKQLADELQDILEAIGDVDVDEDI
eukprot:TRINITY_DN4339_c0_g2_i1.p1 TRINITY_DN4339_c0_g2~~TRINITY_DN4339_c0_g2_i1.p1  ORF type:complete len:943 (-),score=160.44 TRINITY_DN4339_c0_g2_i1:50-2878(-)